MNGRHAAVAVLGAVALAACGGPTVLSTYQSMIGSNQGARFAAHAGVDFGDPAGAPVLAAADGQVVSLANAPTYYDRDTCGRGVLLSHSKFGRYTVYCHLSDVAVRQSQEVKRGDVIGYVGTTGFAGRWAATLPPHVHLELCTERCPFGHADGNLRGTEDPSGISVGCFDPKKTYPTDQLVLTYPVKCAD